MSRYFSGGVNLLQLLSLGSLGRMPCLEILKLEDNPLAMLKQYRRVILGVMQDGVVKQLTLDGIRVTRKELVGILVSVF